VKLLVRIIRYSPRQFWSLVLCAFVIYCVLPVPLGLLTRSFFNAVTRTSAGLNVWTAIGLLVAVQVAQVAGELALAFPWSGLQQRTFTLFQHNLFAGILRGYGRYGLSEPPAASISRFRDEPMSITSGSLDAICDLIGRAMFAVIAAALMWRISPTATLAAFAPVIATSVLTDALGTRAANYGIAARRAGGQLSGFLGEALSAQLAITVAGAPSRAANRVAELSEERRRLSVRDAVFAQTVNSINFHLVNVSTGVVLVVVANAIRRGSFSVGDFALFVVFLDQLQYLPPEIGRLITELKQTERSVERMSGLVPGETRASLVQPVDLERHLRRSEAQQTVPALARREHLQSLEVRDLTYRYAGTGRGVDEVSFMLERGSLTVVTGRVGSGKSTLLSVLLGLLPADAGSIWWNDSRVEDPATFFVPPHAAYTPQVPRLFSDTLRDNIALGRTVTDTQLDEAISDAVLKTDVDTLPHGLDTVIGTRGVRLSGGQSQRAAAARMFLCQADLLVIDDLSSALDAETETELWTRLFSRRGSVTALIVTHRPAALAKADQVLLIEEGRLSDRGALSELLSRSPQMRSLWQQQSPGSGA
jgi:ABC-type multidrug transport system fused ATPase/permease subunit